MIEITTLANQLNKDDDYIAWLCEQKHIDISWDPDGGWVRDDDAKKLLEQEINEPTRYNKRGMECIDVQKVYCDNKNIQYSFLCNILKYLYRRNNIGDLEKAKVYLEKWIEDAKYNGVIK